MKQKANKMQILIISLIALAVLSAIILPYPASDITIYLAGCGACFALAKYLGVKKEGNRPTIFVAILISLPAIAIAINNFPWVAYFIEKPELIVDQKLALSLALCFVGALFEEAMFRYLVMELVLEKRRDSIRSYIIGIVLSGAIFGAYHIFNIFFGASIPYTLLQVVYTTLFGSMLCVVCDKTKRLWLCVLVHFVYNVGGDSVKLLGIQDQWVLPEIILTAAVAVLVFVFYLLFLIKDKKRKI